MIKHTRDKFRQKNLHEQRFIIVLCACTLSLFFWFGLYHPLGQAIATLQTRCERLQRETVWLSEQVSAAGLLPDKKLSGKPDELIRSSLKKAGVFATIQQVNASELEITASNVSIERFMQWLEEAQLKHGLRVVAVEFHASKQSSGIITLTRLTIGVKKNG